MKNSSGLNVAKRVVSVALASGAMVFASAGVASAQGASEAVVGNSVGVVAGYDFDRELPLAGVDGRFTFALGSPLALSINPAFNYYFTGRSEFFGASAETTLLQFDLNALLHLALGAVVTPYVGGGMALTYVESRFVDGNDNVISSEDDTRVSPNVLVGATFDTGSALSPYLQGRMTFGEGEDDQAVKSLMVGLNYGF